MPPFGSLYLQRVFVDGTLVGETEMVFNAGTHTDAIRMHYGDFEALSLPVVGAFARPLGAAGAAATTTKTRPQRMVRENQGA
jgi:Ala-tRNA(Pro) deacylase